MIGIMQSRTIAIRIVKALPFICLIGLFLEGSQHWVHYFIGTLVLLRLLDHLELLKQEDNAN
jgi:hypothetical protein